MRFNVTFKYGLSTEAHLEGKDVEPAYVTAADLKKVIEVEQFLERLTGYRVHINCQEGQGRHERMGKSRYGEKEIGNTQAG